MGTSHDVKDLKLAEGGRRRIAWAEEEMPVLRQIRERFAKERPLKGLRISACLHVTTETAGLMRTLQAGGGDLVLTASNPLSTQDDAAASLVHHDEIPVFAIKGEDTKTYYKHIHAALYHKPHLTMDDGADLVSSLHKDRRDLLAEVRGGTEVPRDVKYGAHRVNAEQRMGAIRNTIRGMELYVTTGPPVPDPGTIDTATAAQESSNIADESTPKYICLVLM